MHFFLVSEYSSSVTLVSGTRDFGGSESGRNSRVYLLKAMIALGAKGDWDFRISDLVKTLMKLIFNPCGEFRCARRAQLAKSTLFTSTLVRLGSF